MNNAAAASYKAVPSILIVAPSGRTKSIDLLETLAFCSAHSIVTGRVAAELAVEKAIINASNICFIKR